MSRAQIMRPLSGAIAGIAAALGVALAVEPGSTAAASARQAAAVPLRVVASLHPDAVLYGDPVTAEIDIFYDPRTVDSSSLRVQPSFIPYVVSSAPTVEPLRPGVVRLRYQLTCVTDGCLPTRGPRLLRLEPVTITGLTGRRTVSVTARWPTLRVSSRLAPSDLSGRIRFRSPTTPPLPGYRLPPGPLSGGLIAGAVVCVLAGALLVIGPLATLFRRSTGPRLSRLELAIAYVRDSTRRASPDRRRALALLSEAVDDEGETALAAVAADTAWSEPPPTPAGADELAERAAEIRTPAG
jgi:hypothetical protein